MIVRKLWPAGSSPDVFLFIYVIFFIEKNISAY